MPDSYEPLDDIDETLDAILDDSTDYVAANIDGWERQDATLDLALLAAAADEGATLYALERENEADRFRDYGTEVLGVPATEATPAVALTTWTARTAAPVGGLELEAGTSFVVDAATGQHGFAVVSDQLLAEGATELNGVLVQAIVAGTAANGATGPILFDEPPAWVLSAELEDAATGGLDREDDDTHRARIRATVQSLSRAPVLPEDWELLAQESAVVDRALVLDGYDLDTGLSDQERTVAIFPIDVAGDEIDDAEKIVIEQRGLARREQNWNVGVGAPTYTDVDVDITVAARDGAVHSEVQVAVTAVLEQGELNPSRHGQPSLGERRSWEQKRTIRLYEIAAAADRLEEYVAYVDDVQIAASGDPTVAANLELDGPAPLPRPGTINVTVIDAEA
jgi:hypothetical protein